MSIPTVRFTACYPESRDNEHLSDSNIVCTIKHMFFQFIHTPKQYDYERPSTKRVERCKLRFIPCGFMPKRL